VINVLINYTLILLKLMDLHWKNPVLQVTSTDVNETEQTKVI